jgi:hypothetical protein
MNESPPGEALRNRRVVTSDGIDLGEVDGASDTHIRVLSESSDAPERHLWLPTAMVDEVSVTTVRLNRRRADLHDAVFALSPGQQRAYATLEPTVKIGRDRWLGT